MPKHRLLILAKPRREEKYYAEDIVQNAINVIPPSKCWLILVIRMHKKGLY
jgi:hypothetical protein